MKYQIDPRLLYKTIAEMDTEERGKYLLVACMDMISASSLGKYPWVVYEEPTVKQRKPRKAITYESCKSGYSEEFEQFWAEYKNKVGKGAAWLAWKKINMPKDELLAACLSALAWQNQSEKYTSDNGKYVPHPTTYLNQRRWEDERPPEPANRTMGIGPSSTGRQMVL